MNVKITERRIELSPSLKQMMEKKLAKLSRFFDRIQAIDIIIEPIKHQTSMEIIVKADLVRAQTKQIGNDPRITFDRAFSIIQRQLRKQKAKLFGDKKHLKKKSSLPE